MFYACLCASNVFDIEIFLAHHFIWANFSFGNHRKTPIWSVKCYVNWTTEIIMQLDVSNKMNAKDFMGVGSVGVLFEI